ncbi:hypothetical protein NOI87_28230 [Neorhizobium galegae]|uniref:hypothetical protein n=1 Tax=Neorhizobium galegae TaxID=399 RepID=UPI002105A901|nr:hypothetical protein [Neorhizobium galegae]MCQ1799112.1 hypothetical protein [Neorhizobium galegae]
MTSEIDMDHSLISGGGKGIAAMNHIGASAATLINLKRYRHLARRPRRKHDVSATGYGEE